MSKPRKIPQPIAVRRLGNNYEVRYDTGFYVMLPAARLTPAMRALLAEVEA